MARYDGIAELDPDLTGAGLRIGVVMSRFNVDASEGLLSFCTEELRKRGVRDDDMLIVTVPGVLEISTALYKMADTGKFDALIALGSVIRGETYQFEVLATESAADIAAVQRETKLPIAYALLTTDDDDQALARMHAKGAEAARAAIEMGNLLKQLDKLC